METVKVWLLPFRSICTLHDTFTSMLQISITPNIQLVIWGSSTTLRNKIMLDDYRPRKLCETSY